MSPNEWVVAARIVGAVYAVLAAVLSRPVVWSGLGRSGTAVKRGGLTLIRRLRRRRAVSVSLGGAGTLSVVSSASGAVGMGYPASDEAAQLEWLRVELGVVETRLREVAAASNAAVRSEIAAQAEDLRHALSNLDAYLKDAEASADRWDTRSIPFMASAVILGSGADLAGHVWRPLVVAVLAIPLGLLWPMAREGLRVPRRGI